VYAKHGFEEVSALTDQTLALELVG
jgi:hypothetical protein